MTPGAVPAVQDYEKVATMNTPTQIVMIDSYLEASIIEAAKSDAIKKGVYDPATADVYEIKPTVLELEPLSIVWNVDEEEVLYDTPFVSCLSRRMAKSLKLGCGPSSERSLILFENTPRREIAQRVADKHINDDKNIAFIVINEWSRSTRGFHTLLDTLREQQHSLGLPEVVVCTVVYNDGSEDDIPQLVLD